MKKIVFLLLIFIGQIINSYEVYSQNSAPAMYAVIEGKNYKIDVNAMSKIDITWAKSTQVLKDKNEIYLHIKDAYKNECLAAIGVKEDKNIYH